MSSKSEKTVSCQKFERYNECCLIKEAMQKISVTFMGQSEKRKNVLVMSRDSAAKNKEEETRNHKSGGENAICKAASLTHPVYSITTRSVIARLSRVSTCISRPGTNLEI